MIGAGKGVQKIRKPIEEGIHEYVKSPVGRFFQQVRAGLSPIGRAGRSVFNLFRQGEDQLGSVKIEAMDMLDEFDQAKKELYEPIREFQEKNFINGTPITEKQFAEELWNATTVTSRVDPNFIGPADAKASLLKPTSKIRAVKEIDYQRKIQQNISKAVDMENELKVIDDSLKDLTFKRNNNIITEAEYISKYPKLKKRRAELLNGKYDTKGPIPKLIQPGLRQIRENLTGTKIKVIYLKQAIIRSIEN